MKQPISTYDDQDDEPATQKSNENISSDGSGKRKFGGWKAISFILGLLL